MLSCDDLEQSTAFAKQNQADFPILSDPDKSVATTYDVLMAVGFPNRWTFYIDADGKITYIDKSVSAISAGADIAERLAALNTPRLQ